jgi:hypothetical protein
MTNNDEITLDDCGLKAQSEDLNQINEWLISERPLNAENAGRRVLGAGVALGRITLAQLAAKGHAASNLRTIKVYAQEFDTLFVSRMRRRQTFLQTEIAAGRLNVVKGKAYPVE